MKVSWLPLRPNGTIRLSSIARLFSTVSRRHTRGVLHLRDGTGHSLDSFLPVSEEPVELRGARYGFRMSAVFPPIWALNKPSGVVCSREAEGGHRSVFELLAEAEGISLDAEPIGRLDQNTTGLLLLTLDGQLSQRLRHPSRAVERCYAVTLETPLTPERAEAALREGVALRDGTLVRPVGLAPEDSAGLRWSVTLTEGRYHEVRRLMAALGSRVATLHRRSHGPIVLRSPEGAGNVDGDSTQLSLAPGAVQQLDSAAAGALYARVGLQPTRCWAFIEALPWNEAGSRP